jgi:PAS domain S-box-containing protein
MDNNKLSKPELLKAIDSLRRQLNELEKASALKNHQPIKTPFEQNHNHERILLRTIIDSLPDAIYAKDSNTCKTLANLADLRNMDVKSEKEVLGKTDFDFFPKEIAEGFYADDMSVIKTGKPVLNREEFFVGKDGKKHWLLTTKLPLYDDDGNVIGLVGIGRDITEVKIAQENFQQEKILLRTIIDSLPDAIYAKDSNTCKTLANLADLRNMDVKSEKEVLGKTDFDFFPKEIAEGFYADDMSVIKTGKPVLNREEFITDFSGKKRWLLTSKLPLRDNKDNIIGLVGIGRDITERKIAEEKLVEAYKKLEKTNLDLENANKVKAQFLANMSHEIRTPLNAVIGLTGLLLGTPLNNEQKDYAETILSSGDILLSLINDILDFSKIEAQKIVLEKMPFDIRICIEESMDLVASKAEEKNLELAYKIEEGTSTKIIGDVTRLRQILVNLLSNAIKFTERGEVVVSVSGQLHENNKCSLHFKVKDTGIGIPPSVAENLFQSFTQADASTTRKFGGTGLGLAISKQLSELMGGTMWVESSGIPGEGTTFHFTISAELSIEEEVQKDVSTLAGKKVLIVDDNKTNREILIQQLKSLQMIPTSAATGKEALEIVKLYYSGKSESFDLAILDYHMPEMDGIMLSDEIIKILSNNIPPMLLLSSYSYHENKDQLSHFAATLTKPIKLTHLHDILITVLNKKEATVKKFDKTSIKFDASMGSTYPLRILVADDNKVNLKVALRFLEKVGYRADTAFNGFEVIDAMHRQRYDIILMDVQMPEMDGEQATIEIRKQFPSDVQPLIFAVTANALKSDLERYIKVGMNGYIVKPFKLEDLVGLLIDSYNKKNQENKK